MPPSNYEKLLSSFMEVATRDMKRLEDDLKDLKTTVGNLTTENKELNDEVGSLKMRLQISEGMIEQQRSKLYQQSEQILDLTARTMRDSIIVQGIPEGYNETWEQTKAKLKDFISNDLKIDPKNVQIDRAHRSGTRGKGPRQIIAKLLNQDSKDLIFKNVKNLKDKTHLKVQEQLPAEVNERKKRLWPKFKQAKENPANKVTWNLDKLVVNGVTHTAYDDFQLIEPENVTDIAIQHTQHLNEDGSTFMGHSARVTQKTDVSNVMAKILQDRSLAGATHNMYAYRIMSPDGRVIEGHKDDGEHGASYKMLKMLRDNEVENVMTVVTRWFGNKHMGPKRFQCIEQCANSALQMIDSEDH
jgi:regulator of replication initiation timing